MNTETLPFRSRESTFRLYEPFIARAIKSFPEPVAINPAPLRATTFAARLRDAIWSFHHYQWPSDIIDREIFEAMYNQRAIVVVQTDTTVAIGPKAKRGGHAPGAVVSNATLAAASAGIRFEPKRWNADDVRAVCRLLSSRLLAGPVIIYPPLDQVLSDGLEATFDIALTTDSDKTIIV